MEASGGGDFEGGEQPGHGNLVGFAVRIAKLLRGNRLTWADGARQTSTKGQLRCKPFCSLGRAERAIIYKRNHSDWAGAMQFDDPANDNEDPDVIYARKIARGLAVVLAVGLCAYLVITYILPI